MAEKIRVLIVDDHQLIREGLAVMIGKMDDIEVSATVATGEEAINQTRTNRPDVVLMDIVMAQMSGIEATRWIKEFDPTVKVILLSQEVTREFVSTGIKSGVDGYLPKDVSSEAVVNAVRTVHTGGKFFNDAVMKLVFEDFYTKEKTKPAFQKVTNELTNRENEVLRLAASGKTNKEVAESLFISVKTVETHKTRILEKLGLRNTSELVKYAIANGLITLD
jgi:DNA-binding NarL/FixJ family response regulator